MRIAALVNKSVRVILVWISIFLVAGCGSSPESDAWKTRRIREDGTVSGIPRGRVLVGTPKELPGYVLVRIVDTLGDGIDCRVVVNDREGRMHVGDKTTEVLPGGTCRSTAVVFSGIKLTDIRRLCFQDRPHRQEIVQVSAD